MAKKKKTRKQKILADTKKTEANIPLETSLSNSLSPTDLPHTSQYVFRMQQAGKLSTQPAATTVIKSHDYTHLKHDLIKTGILTTSIIIAQLVLYFILK